jgi:TPR repeat protein
MKKFMIIFLLITSSFALNLTFTKAFKAFNKGVKLQKTNPQKAQKYFQKAYILLSELENKPSSQVYYMLGKMYCNGWGVDRDYKKAEEYFLKAIKLGNERAHCCIVRLYIRMNKKNLAKKYLNSALSNKAISNYCNDIDPNTLKEKK